VKEGMLITPSPEVGILEGITRRVVIDEHSLGAGHPGPLTIFLMKAFREAVKEMIRD